MIMNYVIMINIIKKEMDKIKLIDFSFNFKGLFSSNIRDILYTTLAHYMYILLT